MFADRNYMGHMNYDISKPHLDALLRAVVFNQNQVAFESSPSTAMLEVDFISRISALIGYDHKAWGYITTGGTSGNIVGLWNARDKARANGNNDNIVLGSKFCHYSIKKACRILGLSFQECEIDVNTGSVILPDFMGGVLAIVANIGTTVTGVIDDLESILTKKQQAELKYKRQIWLHADAAWGGYFCYLIGDNILSEYAEKQLKLVKHADSVVIDPHKAGFAPYGSGTFLMKCGKDRKYVDCTESVKYLETRICSSCTTLEGSRSGSQIASVYFGHKVLDETGVYKTTFKNIIQSSQLMKKELKETFGDLIEIFEPTDLGIVLFKLRFPDEFEQNDRKLPSDPMNYFVKKFCVHENVANGKLRLVFDEIEHEKFFRCVIMDPNFITFYKEFVGKLFKEYKEYCNAFDNFVDTRLKNILSISELGEPVDTDTLKELIVECSDFFAYNGFEPSGRIHIAQAVVTVLNANTITKNGGKMILYIADWFAKMNQKIGGDLEKIREIGEYFIEVFKACGIDMERTQFVWASEHINNNPEYLETMIDIATNNSLNRIQKCCQIMGRKDGDALTASQVFYPVMQAADVFTLNKTGVDICQLGLDQRKVNMLAIEYAASNNNKIEANSTSTSPVFTNRRILKTPIILSHHMLMGLKGPGNKMSKSDPMGAVFMEDTEEEILLKMQKALCPDEIFDPSNPAQCINPIYEYIRYIVLRWYGKITLCGKEYSTIEDIEKDFKDMNKKVLKEDVAKYVNQIVEPVRQHFKKPWLKDLLERVREYRK